MDFLFGYIHWSDFYINNNLYENCYWTMGTNWFVLIGKCSSFLLPSFSYWRSHQTTTWFYSIKTKNCQNAYCCCFNIWHMLVNHLKMVFHRLFFGYFRFPQQLYFILASVYKSIPEWPGTAYVYLTSYFFAMSNSMYNPFLYCCMNNR